jgi:5-methyltetrahydrofolate--homocysteine methyltransferase
MVENVEYSFYHLDGKGQIPHLEMLLSLEKLKGIQWIPGDGAPPPEQWPDLLRRIRDGGKLCQLYVTAAGALEILRTFGGKGFALAITDIADERQATEFLAAAASIR